MSARARAKCAGEQETQPGERFLRFAPERTVPANDNVCVAAAHN